MRNDVIDLRSARPYCWDYSIWSDCRREKGCLSSRRQYGINNEFGFDYLRSNMAFTAEDRLQWTGFAIIDEVDSILIDEARTPLIISGLPKKTQPPQPINQIHPRWKSSLSMIRL